MEKEELEITIDKEGNVSIEVKGVKGQKCRELTKPLEEAIGEVVERSCTVEYYEQPNSISQKDRVSNR